MQGSPSDTRDAHFSSSIVRPLTSGCLQVTDSLIEGDNIVPELETF